MSRTFQDENFRVWEAFPSGNRQGYSENTAVVFHCLTDRSLRPRYIPTDGDSADAERAVRSASREELLRLLERSHEVS